MIKTEQLADPIVRAVVEAINAGDLDAFLSAFAPDPTMSDDGSDRDFQQWIDREIFSSGGHLDVVTQSDDGRSLIAQYRNDTWGEMRTAWAFIIENGKVTRLETGQA